MRANDIVARELPAMGEWTGHVCGRLDDSGVVLWEERTGEHCSAQPVGQHLVDIQKQLAEMSTLVTKNMQQAQENRRHIMTDEPRSESLKEMKSRVVV